MRRPKIPGQECDYWAKLSPEDRAWLKQFNDETTNAYFSKKKTPLITEKRKRREIDRARYARRNDAYCKAVPRPMTEQYGGSQTPDLEEALDILNPNQKLTKYFRK